MNDEVRLLFHDLADLSVEQREAYFRVHEIQANVRSEVEALLSFDLDEELLTTPVASYAAKVFNEGAVSDTTRCGPYRLLRLLGRGGMGAVYLAERADGEVEQQVAVKLLRFGRDEPFFRDRFLRERQILAKLNHPLIGGLLNAGHNTAGQPYLVMEYIDGVAIDVFAKALDVRAKLDLFRQVCDAVSYAHRNLVVHRDLKPSNILVDHEGRPRLLDFGIAKVLDDGLGKVPERTSTMMRALTPQYASPEQVRGEPITTASDVYSLGVLLYKLLTDRLPYEFPTLSPAAVDHIVCEVEPAPPCAGEDLDNILLMALRKEPSRRYLSVQHLADDIGRALADRPVLARPDTIRYRTAKFVRRHRFSFTAAMLALTGIVAGAGIAMYEAQIAKRRFQDVRTLAHTFVFDLHDEIAKLEGSTKVREMMVRTGLEYLDNLSKSAGSDLDLQREIAAGYMKMGDAQGFPTKPNLGRTADAVASYRKAGEIYQKIASAKALYLPDLGNYYLNFGGLMRFTGDRREARALTELAIHTFDRTRGTPGFTAAVERRYLGSWCTLGDIDEDQGANREAWREYSKCRDLARVQVERGKRPVDLWALAQADERVGTSAQELGLLSQALTAFDEDESLLRKAVAADPRNPNMRRAQALLHQFRSMVYNDDARPNLGDPARGLQNARRYLAVADEMVKRDQNDTSARVSYAIAANRVAFSLAVFDSPGAVRMAADSLRMLDQLIASGKTDQVIRSNHVLALRRLSQAQLRDRQFEAARGSAEAALAERQAWPDKNRQSLEEHLRVVQALVLAGETNAAANHLDRAESLLREARDQGQSTANPKELTTLIPLAQAEQELGALYVRLHRQEDARGFYQRAADVWKRWPEPNEFVDLQKTATARLLTSIH